MRWTARIFPSRRGLGISAALLLATAALAGLSIQSVYREARVRKQLIVETNRSIADLVSARLDAAMVEADRGLAAQFQGISPHAESLLQRIGALEKSQPWLQPLVLVADPHAGDRSVDKTFPDAERAEHLEQDYKKAASLYAVAAASARGSRRAAALNGKARAEVKAGAHESAVATYRQLIAEIDPLDRESARFVLIAREQLKADLYRFLSDYRFVLDEDTYDFYRSRIPAVSKSAEAREQRIEEIAMSVRSPTSLTRIIPLTDSHVAVAHVWTLSNARALLAGSLTEPGPWRGVTIRLNEDTDNAEPIRATIPLARSPQWRISASPQSGSVDALASKEVSGFAALLALVFATVVVAMFLAARSVSRELALSQMRSDFVASVSHELKTPLSLIRMFAESLREGWVAEDKRRGYYEVITRESERLTGLINNVLDFSRIESGTQKYQRTTVDLRDVLLNLLERYRYHLQAAHIDLATELPHEAISAFVDSEAIEQVVVNLLSNAVKYMGDADRQPRRVTVSLSATPERAIIRVADTGIGMSEEDRIHIFERFWRANDERVRAVAGSGLGLTLVKHIVEAHNGAVVVESIPNLGSTFAVTLPLAVGVKE